MDTVLVETSVPAWRFVEVVKDQLVEKEIAYSKKLGLFIDQYAQPIDLQASAKILATGIRNSIENVQRISCMRSLIQAESATDG